MSIRDNIVALSSAPVAKEIDGKQIYIRRLTIGEADQINAANADAINGNPQKLSQAVRLLARFLGDENGAPVFDLAKPEDVIALQAIPAVFAARLVEYGNAVNVPPKEDVEKKG